MGWPPGGSHVSESPPARLVSSAAESQDSSFTCLNRFRSVVPPFPSLIEFSTVLLLIIHQPAYANGSQDHKENVTRGTILEFWKELGSPRRGSEQRQEPATGAPVACRGHEAKSY